LAGEITVSGKGKIKIWLSTCIRNPKGKLKTGPFTHSIKKEIGTFKLTEKPSTYAFSGNLAPYENGYIYISVQGEALIDSLSGVVEIKGD
jgi:hypothetical protein